MPNKKNEPLENQEPKDETEIPLQRIINAIVKRLEGDDQTGKYEYLTKPDKDNIKTLSVLSDSQLDSTAECCYLGSAFPSMSPLSKFVRGLAEWSPSKQGKRAEQLTATMIHQENSIIPTILQTPGTTNQKKDKKEKEVKEEMKK
jgi:hypothetical protein